MNRTLPRSSAWAALCALPIVLAAACDGGTADGTGDGGGERSDSGGSAAAGGKGSQASGGAAGEASSGGNVSADGGANTMTGGSVSADGGSAQGGDPGTGGAGPNADGFLSDYESGTRLLVQFLRAEGAPDRFERFFDQELGTACKAGKLDDGNWYCLPQRPEGLTFLGYADDQCELPVYQPGEGCAEVPKYFTETVGGCNESFQVHALEPALTTGPLFALNSGTCSPSGSAFAADSLLRVGQLGPEEFVLIEREAAPSAGELTVMLDRGDDGSLAVTALVDASSGLICGAAPEVGLADCIPSRRAFGVRLFDDATCTQSSLYAYSSVPPACGEVDVIESSGYYAPGPEASTELWSTAGGGCQPHTELVWLQNIIEVGAPIAEDFGSFEVRLTGDARLTVPLIFEEEVPLLVAATPFHDTEQDRDCEPKLVEGELRCLPSGFNLREINPDLTRYADSACTQPLIYCGTGNCLNEVYYDASEQDSCTGAPKYAQMQRPLSAFTDPVYQKDDQGSCIGPVEPSPVWITEELTPSDFALVERVTL